MPRSGRHGIFGTLLLAALACGDDDGTCRCGGPSSVSPPALPPEQDPKTVLGAPFELSDGAVSSAIDGINGHFSVSHSELGSTIELRPGGASEVCVAGELGLVLNEEWERYRGAQLSMSLNEPPEASRGVWERGDSIGLAFDLVGTVPAELRIIAALHEQDTLEETFCVLMPTWPGHTHYAYLDEMKTVCWSSHGGEFLPDVPLLRIAWDLPASAAVVQEFDFCVANLRPIRAGK